MEQLKSFTQSKTPVLMAFYTDNCGPCMMLNKILDELKKDLGDSIKIIKVDIDKEKQLTIDFDSIYQIMGTPTMLLFREGKLLWKHAGVLFKYDLIKRIGPFINQNVNNIE
ncbi:MAG: thioredoxin family protein [Weeksellaceae bacterium]|nr:thioredoxin family protein [Weeksellaceae bacterium]